VGRVIVKRISRFFLLCILSIWLLAAGPTIEEEHINTLHPDLQLLFTTVRKNYPLKVLEGFRNSVKQQKAFESGRSKLQWPHSPHNTKPSLAVDVAPLPIDWTNLERFYHFAGYVKATADQLGIPIIWGGDWDGDGDFHDHTLVDLVHWELIL
jgi:hypothetical protein